MMEGMNVLYICEYGASYAGNFIASISALAEKVNKKNCVYFLLPKAAQEYSWTKCLPVDESYIFWCDFSFKALLQECRQLSAQLGNKKTVVHTHFIADFFLLAIKASFSNVICHYHMTVPVCYNFVKKMKCMVRRLIYRDVILVGVSDAVTEDMKRYFRKIDCECILNAIDFQTLEKSSEGTVAPEIFQSTETFRILMHGTDFYRKAVDLAATVVKELNMEYPNAFCLYVTTHDVPYAQALVDGLIGKNINIQIMNPVENIKKIYDNVELFISPSRAEAFGYAVVEAAYATCQVAASDVPGQNTMKPVPGILWFEKDDAEGLKQAILRAKELADTGCAGAIKEEQRAFVVQKFRIEEWVERNMALYEKYYGK